jgi:hypothetical protein
MKRLSLFAVAFALAAAGCSSSTTPTTAAPPTKPTFTAALSTANEVPPITNSEAGGRGDATITIDTTAATVTFVVNLSGFPAGTPINIAHIHEAVAGVNGSVRVATTLAAGQVTLTTGSGSFTSVASGVDQALMQAIIANPAGYYFNAHSTINAGGVVRGQLVKVS